MARRGQRDIGEVTRGDIAGDGIREKVAMVNGFWLEQEEDFCDISCAMSPPRAMITFEKFISPIDSRIEAVVCESRTVDALRRALLFTLNSGELYVENPERFINEDVR